MSTGRILIVDDSDNVRNVLQMNFEWLGYSVDCARDGEEALRMVREASPDLIILDVMMPRRNGYQVCRTLKMDPALRRIPVIFLTAKDQKEDRFWGKDCGADEYLTKPFSAAKLERVIAKLIERRAAAGAEGDITARLRALRDAGTPCALAIFALDARSLTVFRQKYGEIRYQEALDGLRNVIGRTLGEEQPDALVERQGEGVYRAVLACEEDQAGVLAARIRFEGSLFLRSLYSREDSERGYVVTRNSPEAGEIHVPLLSVEARIESESQAA